MKQIENGETLIMLQWHDADWSEWLACVKKGNDWQIWELPVQTRSKSHKPKQRMTA